MSFGSLAGTKAARATVTRSIALSVPATTNLPSLEHDVVLARFHQVRGDAAALGDDLLRGDDHGGAGRDGGARAERAGADRDLVGVAVVEADPVGRDAEPVGDDLAERGGVALAVVVGADRDGDGAGRIEPDLGMLDQPGIGGLDGARYAEPAQLAAPARLGAAGGKAGIVRLDQAILQVLAEVAAVIGVDQRRLVGHRGGRDHVAAAQLGADRCRACARRDRPWSRPHRRPPGGRRRDRGRSSWCW